jgi:hypothetical protein
VSGGEIARRISSGTGNAAAGADTAMMKTMSIERGEVAVVEDQ